MPVKTKVNREYLRDIVWQLRTNLNKLNERAGLSPGYIYQLAPERDDAEVRDVSISTLDKLHNALEEMMNEQNINPPDNLWQKLLVHEEIN